MTMVMMTGGTFCRRSHEVCHVMRSSWRFPIASQTDSSWCRVVLSVISWGHSCSTPALRNAPCITRPTCITRLKINRSIQSIQQQLLCHEQMNDIIYQMIYHIITVEIGLAAANECNSIVTSSINDTNGQTDRRRESNLVHFCLKMWHPVATILINHSKCGRGRRQVKNVGWT